MLHAVAHAHAHTRKYTRIPRQSQSMRVSDTGRYSGVTRVTHQPRCWPSRSPPHPEEQAAS
eukprot:3764510-Rhodomonas_salina.2